LLFVASATVPSHATIFGSLDKTDLKCRDALVKSYGKAIATGDKVSVACHKDRNAGKIDSAIDCNALDGLNADAKGKFAKVQSNIAAAALKKCATASAHARIDLVSCPEPCLSSTGVSNPMADYAEVGECLGCLAREVVEERNNAIFPNPAVPLGAAEQSCHQALTKGYGKYLSTALKDRAKCQKLADKAGDHDIATCAASDDKGKIQKALIKASDAVSSACTGADLTQVASCSNVSVGELNACLTAETDSAAAEAFAAPYLQPEDGTVCPTSATIITRSGYSPEGEATVTRIDTGWNGLGHGQDVVHGYAIAVGLACPSPTVPCGVCDITGVVDVNSQFDQLARCKDDPSISCTQPFAVDPACAGTVSGECSFYLGPPQAVSASNTPVCTLNRLQRDITGTMDPDTGDAEVDINLRAKVHLGIQQTQPCPICIGDLKAQDGVSDGVCFGGLGNGNACDVHAVDATFAAPPNGLSMDCVPSPGQNVSGAGLSLSPSLSTGPVSLPFGTPCDSPLQELACACAVCSGASTLPCNSNAECDLGECVGSVCANNAEYSCSTNADCNKGACASSGAGDSRYPNGCSDLTCTPIGDGLGECQAGDTSDVTSFCDGQLRANGQPYLTCAVNSDCSSLDPVCNDGDCGACTVTTVRTCFVDPIALNGVADPIEPIGVSAFCIPPTSNVSVNAATKLPGAGRAIVQLELLRNFAE